jgi:hypothetical protein
MTIYNVIHKYERQPGKEVMVETFIKTCTTRFLAMEAIYYGCMAYKVDLRKSFHLLQEEKPNDPDPDVITYSGICPGGEKHYFTVYKQELL